jgi:hypothetical protein
MASDRFVSLSDEELPVLLENHCLNTKNEIGAAKEYCLNIVSRRKGGIMLFSDQLLRRDF